MARQRLRILCFGDSLTSGFCHFGLESHPYSARLRSRLAEALPGAAIDVHTDGFPGDQVCSVHFENRLQDALFKQHPYDWVIMLGGTNDLGYGTSSQAIFQNLEDCWDRALLTGSKVLALTVPECAADVRRLNDARADLNRRILEHRELNFYTFDLRSHIPYHSLTDEERDLRWDDGLHLTPEGYSWMGDHIADALLPLIEAGEAHGTRPQHVAAPTSSVAAAGDDDFTEEGGSDGDISQGYIVVRKKDLY